MTFSECTWVAFWFERLLQSGVAGTCSHFAESPDNIKWLGASLADVLEVAQRGQLCGGPSHATSSPSLSPPEPPSLSRTPKGLLPHRAPPPVVVSPAYGSEVPPTPSDTAPGTESRSPRAPLERLGVPPVRQPRLERSKPQGSTGMSSSAGAPSVQLRLG